MKRGERERWIMNDAAVFEYFFQISVFFIVKLFEMEVCKRMSYIYKYK